MVMISPGEMPPSSLAARKLAALVKPSAVMTGTGGGGGRTMLTVAVAERVGSATLVARTVMVAGFRKVAGAV